MSHIILKSFAVSFLLTMLQPLAAPAQPSQPSQSSTPAPSLAVMTFNLKYASLENPHSWPTRRPVMRELLHKYSPDLIATQEGLYQQLRDIHADLPGYDWIGLGRLGGSRDEFCAIFYKKDRVEPLEFDHFWLSDTPDVIGSKSWGNNTVRMATWIRFRDLSTKQEFYFFNTHFDHESQPAREKSAELIRQRITNLPLAIPTILAGDFNVPEDDKVHNILTEGNFLTDTYLTAKERRGPRVNTFHAYRPARENGARIDWILLRGPADVLASEIITFIKDNQPPSDHFPVMTWLKLGS